MPWMPEGRLSEAVDLAELIELRHELHRFPEISGEERETAARILAALQWSQPDQLLTGLGGHGVAAVYDSGLPGPRVLLRCELDGLPITDLGQRPYRSQIDGRGHQCGHDGHMAMMIGMSRILGQNRPPRGAVILMFQPAEEDGSGAQAVVRDPAYAGLRPDFCFAIHNYPGVDFGKALLLDGPMCCASRGMVLRLTGRTAHASQPEAGLSPMAALAELMPALAGLSAPQAVPTADPAFRLVTVTHASMGAPAFGIAPGEASLFATLRSLTDEGMMALVQEAEALARRIAGCNGLALDIGYRDVFVTCANAPEAAAIVRRAVAAAGMEHGTENLPFRASEDFGHFGKAAHSALLMLGSGHDVPALHNPDFDFPDALIPVGIAVFTGILQQIYGP